MNHPGRDPIFARFSASQFVGRTDELARLIGHTEAPRRSNGLILLSQPLAGTSELLQQAYDRCFHNGGDVIPFYFAPRESDRTALGAARRFAYEFLVQAVAFRRRDAAIINTAANLDDLTRLAPPADGDWVDRLAEIAADDHGHSSMQNYIAAPLIAASYGARSLVLIDSLHVANGLDGGAELVHHIESVFSRGTIPFVLAGHRRFMYGRSPFPAIPVESFSLGDAGRLVELFAAQRGVAINDQSRDLIAVQLNGSAGHMSSFVDAAASMGCGLETFDKVSRVYADEIFGGRIARRYGNVLDRVFGGTAGETPIVRSLAETLETVGGRVPAAYWHKNIGLAGRDLTAALAELDHEELITADSAFVAVDGGDLALSDYIRGRSSLEIDGSPRARAIGTLLSAGIKRAPQLMARYYRRSSAIGLKGLLDGFDGRRISSALIDYARFKSELKGADEDTALTAIREDQDGITLPHIVYTADTAAFYPKFDQLCDAERSAVAVGFTDAARKDETTWLAAEIDSKLEADRETAEFWCDRLEMVAASCGFKQFQMWLVAPEGFADDAMDVLAARGAIGSSRRQAELLAGLINAEINTVKTAAAAVNEYEIVIPMGRDTEMIAAHTVEEIAKRHGFQEKAINQIKTALVEACINAAEHSLSPDRRIHQRFQVTADRMTITVSNRGVRLADKPQVKSGESTRRGWGLKLINGLMDKVEIESTDDGTRLVMVKNLAANNTNGKK